MQSKDFNRNFIYTSTNKSLNLRNWITSVFLRKYPVGNHFILGFMGALSDAQIFACIFLSKSFVSSISTKFHLLSLQACVSRLTMSHEGLIWELYSYTYIAGVNHAYSNSTNFDGHFSNENVSEPFRTKRVRNSNHNMVGVLFYSCGVYACVNYPQPVNKSHINLNAIKLTDMWQIDIVIFFDLRTLWFGVCFQKIAVMDIIHLEIFDTFLR